MTSLFIAGTWTEGEGPALQSVDPATGRVVWSGHEASEAQLDRAFDAAHEAFEAWSDTPLGEREACLRRFAKRVDARRDDLARVISLETGKPTWEALTEVASLVGKVEISIEAYEQRTGMAERDAGAARSVVRHAPHGVLGVLGPYNFPCHLPNGHIVPALLAGNTLVLKPSEHTPRCAVELAELWKEAGLPDGCLNVVQGGREVGRALVGHTALNGLLFTGSAAAGHAIHRAFAGHPEAIVGLEMGGNNPLVVVDGGEPKACIYTILQSAFATAGQRCTCARRLFVPSSRGGDVIVQQLIEAVATLRVGRFDDPEPPYMGPVISERAADELLAAQARLLALGGEALCTMRKLEDDTGLLSPALVDVSGVDGLPDEEYFGPLLQLLRYDDFDEAVRDANATRFGLAAGLIGGGRAEWATFLRGVRAGVVNWNQPLTGASSAAPFGGIGASGNHRPSAFYAADYCAYPVASLEQDTPTLPAELPPGMTL